MYNSLERYFEQKEKINLAALDAFEQNFGRAPVSNDFVPIKELGEPDREIEATIGEGFRLKLLAVRFYYVQYEVQLSYLPYFRIFGKM